MPPRLLILSLPHSVLITAAGVMFHNPKTDHVPLFHKILHWFLIYLEYQPRFSPSQPLIRSLLPSIPYSLTYSGNRCFSFYYYLKLPGTQHHQDIYTCCSLYFEYSFFPGTHLTHSFTSFMSFLQCHHLIKTFHGHCIENCTSMIAFLSPYFVLFFI